MRTVLAAMALLVAFPVAAEEQKRPSIWKQLTSEPELPAELRTDVESFPMAKVMTWRNPLPFAPFRVAKYKGSWVRSSASGTSAPVEDGEIRAMGTDSSQSYSFTLEESKAARWDVSCAWRAFKESLEYEGRKSSSEMDLGGEGTLECTFAQPGQAPSVTLAFDAALATQGVGFTADVTASLRGAGTNVSIQPLLLARSRALGDVHGGWVFSDGGKPVAALTSRGPALPVRFVAATSLDTNQRSLLAAASAALVLYERNTGN